MLNRVKVVVYFTADEKLMLFDKAKKKGQSVSDLVRVAALNWFAMLDSNDVQIKLTPKTEKPFSLVDTDD